MVIELKLGHYQELCLWVCEECRFKMKGRKVNREKSKISQRGYWKQDLGLLNLVHLPGFQLLLILNFTEFCLVSALCLCILTWIEVHRYMRGHTGNRGLKGTLLKVSCAVLENI